MKPKPEPERAWPVRADSRTRVLVEHSDPGVGFAMQELLKSEAYDVRYCGGPDHLKGHQCSLVADGRCSLAEGADVVVQSLNLDRPDQRAVLEGIRGTYPDTPVVIEVPTPSMASHAELLDGYTIVPMPATRTALTAAVGRALTGA